MLFRSNTTLETEIQERLNQGDLIMVTNPDSSINKSAGYNPSSPYNELSINNFSVLIKNNNDNDNESYFSAPSFGSRYNQVKSTCFLNGVLTRPIDTNVYNGS